MKRRFAPLDTASQALPAVAALFCLAATTGCKDATGPTTGAAHVMVTTTGIDLDADGYMVTVDSEPGRQVAPVDAITFRELPTGAHTVALGGVAVNCVIGGENPRTVSVAAGSTAEIAFAVACVPDVGSVHVTTATTGVDLDPDGYAVSVDGGAGQAVGGSAALTLSDLRSGEHLVRLDGLAPNCAVSDASPRPVTVAFGATDEVAFAVACVADVGSLRVTAVTTGAELDPNGYIVGIPGNGPVVPVNGSVTFPVPAAEYAIALMDIAANCAASGPNPRAVTISFGATTEVAFVVACTAVTGSIRVTTATTGADLDSDGYAVSPDGGPGEIIAVSGALTIATVTAGDHMIALGGVAANCVVDGDNPRTVSVAGGATAEVAFAITCAALPPAAGTLRVTTATSGAQLDPDGFIVSVDGGPGQSVAVNDTIVIADLAGGDHAVVLGGVAENCAVDGTNPRTVGVPGGTTTRVTFTVACTALTGSVRVTTTTTGAELDPNGYLVEVMGNGQSIPANGSITYPGVPAGERVVQLSDVASNCEIGGANPQVVTVTSGDTAEVAFAVTCSALSGNLHVTVTTTGADLDPDGYTVYVQGLCRLGWDGDGGFGYECDYERTESVGVNGAVTIPDVPVGATVELQGVARNCTVVGENPRTATADVAFAVRCLETGGVRVTVATTGFDLDPNGYSVLVQAAGGDVSYGVTVDGTVTIQLLPGEYSLTLGGVAGNCTVSGPNAVTLTVVAGATLEIAFAVSCTALGSMHVTVATTGFDLDPDGYRVRVDGAWYSTQAAPVNGAITISGLPAGDHTVALEGVAATCVVEGTNPRSVSVAAGGTADVAFVVTCAALGSMQVTIATTGFDIDPDGYRVRVDVAWYPTQAAPVNGAITISGLPAGDHTVALDGAAANCAVDGANPRAVSVPAGGTAEVAFAVNCTAVTGSVRVTTSTAGVDLDLDGYTVVVDPRPPPLGEDDGSASGAATTSGSSASSPIGLDGTVLFSGLGSGDHTVVLAGVAANCAVDGANPREVNVAAGDITEVAFAITCNPLPVGALGTIGFSSERTGNAQIFLMNADSSGLIATLGSGFTPYGGRETQRPGGHAAQAAQSIPGLGQAGNSYKR